MQGFDLVNDSLTAPFPNLVSYESIGATSYIADLRKLLPARESLKKIHIIWEDQGLKDLFIPLILFSKLEQLRLYLRNQRWKGPDETETEWHLPIDCTTTLTHLTLYDLEHSYSAHVNGLLRNLHFPNLRMFSLQDTAQDAHQVFDFVNRHPSILEFNVSFTYDEVRLRCIPKLIDGTGTWKMPSTPEELAKYSGSINNLLVDQPTLEDVENVPPEDCRPPDDIDTGAMYCRSFAFCRRPLPGVTTRSSSAGSRQPRYEATALAFCITRQEDLWGEPYVIRDLAVVLYILYRFFPRLEQLRIFDETVPEAEMSWYEYMVRSQLCNPVFLLTSMISILLQKLSTILRICAI